MEREQTYRALAPSRQRRLFFHAYNIAEIAVILGIAMSIAPTILGKP
ncbi:MAG: hypothetical protein Q8M11_09020 [Sulfuritalea sp.]|nr:hypothetical protein [Sulfuritalea sp.]